MTFFGPPIDLSFIDIIGFVASALVFLTFCMRTLLPLRLAAIASNIFFIAYGFAAGLIPILALHLLLFPMNVWRTVQQLRTRQRMRAAFSEEPNLDQLLPFATFQTYADEAVIFRQGDVADRFYIVAEGEVVVEEFGQILSRGDVFGEIAFFRAEGLRTATVRARGEAKLTWVDRETLMRVYRDNPDFALFLTRLMVTRTVQNQSAVAVETKAPKPGVSKP